MKISKSGFNNVEKLSGKMWADEQGRSGMHLVARIKGKGTWV